MMDDADCSFSIENLFFFPLQNLEGKKKIYIRIYFHVVPVIEMCTIKTPDSLPYIFILFFYTIPYLLLVVENVN